VRRTFGFRPELDVFAEPRNTTVQVLRLRAVEPIDLTSNRAYLVIDSGS
jgi:hypothetical protein